MNVRKMTVWVLLCFFIAGAVALSLRYSEKKNVEPVEEDNSSHPGWVSLSGRVLSVGEIYNLAIPSVVLVHSNNRDGTGSDGTGFFIDSGARILTNFHVIEDAEKIFIKLRDGNIYPVIRVIAESAKWDLALIEAHMPIGYSVPLSLASGLPPISSDVVVVGAPNGFPHSLASGILLGAKGRGLEMIEMSAPIRSGFSGSPIFNDRGQVIGVAAQGTLQDAGSLGFGSSCLVVSQFLKEKPSDREKTVHKKVPGQENALVLLTGGGYKAYTKNARQPLYAKHSLDSPVSGALEKNTQVRVVREWLESDPRVARLKDNILIEIPDKPRKKFLAGDMLKLENPTVSGKGMMCVFPGGGEDLKVLLDESQIERMAGKKWCQVMTDSGEHGWVIEEDLSRHRFFLLRLLDKLI